MALQILLFCLFFAFFWWFVSKGADLIIDRFPGKQLHQAQKEYAEIVARNKNLERIRQQNLTYIKFLKEKPEEFQSFLELLDSELNKIGIPKRDE